MDQFDHIGVNDLHIAGHARSEGSTLVTNNLKEFERVEALRLENWVRPGIYGCLENSGHQKYL